MADAKQIDLLISGIVDSSGNRLSGGTAEFREPGTTILKTIWEDANKVNVSANPVTLSERGTVNVFGDGEYDVVFKDMNGNLVDDPDGLTFTLPSDQSSLGIDASLFGTSQNAEAIALAIASASGEDRQVFLNPGEWLIDSDLTIPSNINLFYVMGAYSNIVTGFTLAYNGTWSAPLYQIHRGAGSLVFDDRNNNIPSIHELNGVHDNRTFNGTNTFKDAVTINSTSGDSDFTVNGDMVANLLKTDASQDNVGIGVSPSPEPRLHIQKNSDNANTELLRLDRTSASVTDNDSYDINFNSENDNNIQKTFVKQTITQLDVSDSTEKGEWGLSVADGVDGSVEQILKANIDNLELTNATFLGLVEKSDQQTATLASAGTLTDVAVSYVDASGGDFIADLPSAVGIEKRVITIKNIGSSGVVTIDGDGSETIGGDLTKDLGVGGILKIISDGTNWLVLDYYSGWLTWIPTYSASGAMTFTAVTTTFARYVINNNNLSFQIRALGTTGGVASVSLRFTLPTGLEPVTETGYAARGYVGVVTAVRNVSCGFNGTEFDSNLFDNTAWSLGTQRGFSISATYEI